MRLVSAFLFIVMLATTSWAQSIDIGETVVVASSDLAGAPIHRQARSSYIGRIANGTPVVVEAVHQDDRWVRISVEDAEAWILSRYLQPDTTTVSSPASPSDDHALLQATCDETLNRSLLEHDLFDVCFDRNWRIPAWSAYVLRRNAMSGPGDRHRSRWLTDNRIQPETDQAFDREYVGSGWHRGHLAPAEAFSRTQDAVDFTHHFSNAVPQAGSVNSGAWSKLEARVRRIVESGATVWVFTGAVSRDLPDHCLAPPFDAACTCLSSAGIPVEPERYMSQRIAIPSHTYKVLLVDRGGVLSAYAFVMTNIHRPMGSFLRYQYSVDQVEALAQIDFFSSLDDEIEHGLEAGIDPIDPNRRVTRCQN